MNRLYKIRYNLATPLLFSAQKPIKPIQGDGIYGYAWALKHGLRKTPAERFVENVVLPELPFDKEFDCYTISAGFAAPNSFFEETMILKHADHGQSFAKHGLGNVRISNAMGEFRAVREIYWRLLTPYIEFFAKGNEAGIRELTDIICQNGYLSGKRAIGYGKILNAEIIPIPVQEDWSLWKNGQPTRNIPVDNVFGNIVNKELLIEECGYRPPYWHKAFWKSCYVPPKNMHLPVMPIINENDKFRELFYRNACKECVEILKIKYQAIIKKFIPNLHLIKVDMLPLSSSEIASIYSAYSDQDILRQYLFFAIYQTIEIAEKQDEPDFESILTFEINRLRAIIQKINDKKSVYESMITYFESIGNMSMGKRVKNE